MARTRGAAAKQEAARAKAIAKQEADAGAAVARTVFETAELLEIILLHFPVNKLLVAQRVNAFWKEDICQSKKLQQALYFRPGGEHLVVNVGSGGKDWVTTDEAAKDVVVRPVLNPIMPHFFFGWQGSVFSILNIGFVSPICSRDIYYPLYWAYGSPHSMTDKIGPRSPRQLTKLHEDIACWKNMFVMQPPCSKIAFICGRTGDHFEIANPGGVTLQDLRMGLFNHWGGCSLCDQNHSRRMIRGWTFDGSKARNIRRFRTTPSSAELLGCLQKPEISQLPGVMDAHPA
ncbi:hypothetical protein DOTSEDRAFT_73977 [Dothistroma septosporum NZE10]|uniref:F-box domain-containing protein n=1 Tax=Dothistroma septosporum (strain NZE10 / CBS 128990) TaxID=675120 RepID=N1PI14_DOTSN|nr:hypothetical protein DOTSEDRAFT_73977 [Dothistroma septosporum NZE10]